MSSLRWLQAQSVYKTYFNLRRNPFEITPDPYFLCRTERHNETLAMLYYGVTQHKGFVVMTGDMGTGKTLLVHCLIEILNTQRIPYAYVFNTRLSPLGFLQYVVGDLGLSSSAKDKSRLLLDLGSYLVACHQKGLTTVLVVDEAHHLSSEVLEEIRLLTNLETAQQKLLQIVLAGQPELEQKLELPQLRQLKQRITVRSRLAPLNRQETKAYIEHRLELASAERQTYALFSPEAIDRVYLYSQGVPRVINTLCENALITAVAERDRFVTRESVDKVAVGFRLPQQHANRSESARNDELVQAVTTLLQIHQRLQSTHQGQRMFPPSLGAHKHESDF
ncbi:MAG TPA: AAA family ATPase [Terriglobales bacterium]|nr:AAA family ATPase [Terriglobales bacterium]